MMTYINFVLLEWIAEEENTLRDDDTQERKYVHMCNETGVIPITYFIRHIRNTTFRMRYHGLGPNGAKALVLPLKVRPLYKYQIVL